MTDPCTDDEAKTRVYMPNDSNSKPKPGQASQPTATDSQMAAPVSEKGVRPGTGQWLLLTSGERGTTGNSFYQLQ